MFGTNGTKVVIFHQLALIPEDQLIEVLSHTSRSIKDASKPVQIYYGWLCDFLFTRTIGLSEKESSWAKNLIRFALGDIEGLDFVLKAKKVSTA